MSEEKSVQEDRDLIQRMASKDAAALDSFYQRHSSVAFSLILRIVGNRADAEDVMMDVFWQAWQQSNRYDASRGKPVAWLLTIARTRAIDSVRGSNRQQVKNEQFETQNSPGASLPVTDIYVEGDVRNAVQRALAALSEQQRTPLELAYFQGMSHTEIAAALGQPLGTVKDRIRTGMVHLRKALKAYL
jgi:RNA polymerase sigma-70 factor, ECF subfamily